MNKLHPQLWEIVVKSYAFAHGDHFYLETLLQTLQLSIQFNGIKDRREFPAKQEYLAFLRSLPQHDALIIVQDFLDDDSIQRLKFDNWNEFGDFVKTWRPRLLDYLEKSGIKYNEETRTFYTLKNKPMIISSFAGKDDFISSKFDDIFYNDLKKEINNCYKAEFWTSAFILSRKMIENLVIDVLRLKFPQSGMGNLNLYYRPSDGRFHDFTVLLKNLEDKKDEYGVDKQIITEFISLVKPFRPQANSTAHSIIMECNEKKLVDAKVERMVEYLLKLKNNLINEINSTKTST